MKIKGLNHLPYEYNMSMCKKDNKYCTKLIQMNNWKIPKDYPIRF